MGITFHTQKENYVYHSKNVLCLVKGSPSSGIATPTDRRYLFHGLANYEKRWNTGVPEKQEA